MFSPPSNEGRYVSKRAQFLKRRYDIKDTPAEVIGWAELGYSSSGISDRMGLNKSTVDSHMDDITEVHPTALESRVDEFEPDRPMDEKAAASSE